MLNYALYGRDELGDVIKVKDYSIPDDMELDADYLEIWKANKIEQIQNEYPEWYGFFFEDRNKYKKVTQLIWENPSSEFEDYNLY